MHFIRVAHNVLLKFYNIVYSLNQTVLIPRHTSYWIFCLSSVSVSYRVFKVFCFVQLTVRKFSRFTLYT